MRHSHSSLYHRVIEIPKHAPHRIVGTQLEIGTLTNTKVQAIMIQVACLSIDKKTSRQIQHIGANTISIALNMTEAIDMRYQSPHA